MDLLIGTSNDGKLHEYRTLLAGVPMRFLSPAELELDLEIEENGTTFAENASAKALAFAQASARYAIADDSGLCVDALDGRPGLHTARYGGPGLDDAGRRQRLLAELEDVNDDQRTAHFECVIALANPNDGSVMTMHGVCEGHILRADADGGHGFGYDPIFRPAGYDISFAQMPPDQKDAISHRGRAVASLIPILHSLVKQVF